MITFFHDVVSIPKSASRPNHLSFPASSHRKSSVDSTLGDSHEVGCYKCFGHATLRQNALHIVPPFLSFNQRILFFGSYWRTLPTLQHYNSLSRSIGDLVRKTKVRPHATPYLRGATQSMVWIGTPASRAKGALVYAWVGRNTVWMMGLSAERSLGKPEKWDGEDKGFEDLGKKLQSKKM